MRGCASASQPGLFVNFFSKFKCRSPANGNARSVERRSILKLSVGALGTASTACTRCAEEAKEHASTEATVVARLVPKVRFQSIEGFGTALNNWVAEVAERATDPEFVDFYIHSLGASVLRVSLQEDAVPRRERWQDISATDFLLEGDGLLAARHLFAAKKLMKSSNGTLRVIASVWSPPGWMKENGLGNNGNAARENFGLSEEDLRLPFGAAGDRSDVTKRTYLYTNRLRHDRYEHFAKSLVEWTRLYERHGIQLYALSPQNEPRFSHWFGSCVYTAAELARVIETIHTMFERERCPLPRMFAPETMTHDVPGNRAYLDAMFHGSAGRHLHALASHGYVDGYKDDDSPDSAEKFYRLVAPYKKAIWMTEGGTGGHQWPAPLHQMGAAMMNSLTKGQASVITPWLAIEENESTHGLMTMAGPTKKTSVATHFFRFIRPQMVRIDVQFGDDNGLSMAAFEGPSERVVVLLNRSQSPRSVRFLSPDGASIREVYLTDRHHDIARQSTTENNPIACPAESVVTVLFER